MKEMGFSKHLVVCLIESLYLYQEAAVGVEGEMSEWFGVGKGVYFITVSLQYTYRKQNAELQRRCAQI